MAGDVSYCNKYFLFTFNTLFWIVSIMLISIAVWAWYAKGFFDNIGAVTGIQVDPVIVIMCLGVLTFVLSFTGCIGALRENIVLLKFFSGVLGIIFFAQVIVGILAFIYKDWFHDKFADFLLTTIDKYRDDPDLQNIIDLTQSQLQCCGGASPEDWENNIYFNCTSRVMVNGIFYSPTEKCGVPFSCCKPVMVENSTDLDVVNSQCGYGIRESIHEADMGLVIYTEGCVDVFENWLQSNLVVVAGVFVGFAVFQIIPICVAQSVVQDIENIKRAWRR